MLLFTEIANCEADITFFAQRYHEDTRQWLLKDFDKWFNDPGDSRAYVLLGDPGVGKSVVAGVLTQRSKKAGSLGAAYFCRHNDGTRNDPRCLLGTIACQLCKSNSQYNSIVGGEGGVRKLLSNSNLGVQELFTKLLQEPLSTCTPCQQRKLVIIDALDETHYESREDFLDLIMHRFPLLPKWLLFFITSRPEETVQFRLNKYNPCIKICAGNSEDRNFYQQHERDIKLFLEKNVDFSHLPYSLEDITKRCNGLFLYAFYIARVLEDPLHSGKIDQISDLFPGDIDNFFLQNFTRVVNKIGANLYKKLFGCAIVAPSPLPVSLIPFILKRENSDVDEQEVIDAVSQFVVLRTSDQTFTFLHNLIPTWLTDKKKASRKLFIDRIEAGKYFRDIIAEFLSVAVVYQQWEKPQSVEADLFEYCFRVGVRFLCANDNTDLLKIVFSCLTSYQFIWKRIQNNGIEIYFVIVDLKLAARCQGLSNAEKEILQEIGLALESNVHVLQECPHLLHSCLRNVSKAVRENFLLPDGVSSTWMEWKGIPYPACEIPHDMSCFALSPDKTLLAGGKGQCISIFDACSFEKGFGPVEVLEAGDEINHLEFSPDGRYVFFGRLDKWFSVEKRYVEEFTQFSENCRCYKWGLFTNGGRFIAVQGDIPGRGKHQISCLVNIFCRWAVQELHLIRSSEVSFSCDTETLHGRRNSNFRCRLYALRNLLCVLKSKQDIEWCSVLARHLENIMRVSRNYILGDGELCQDCFTFNLSDRKSTLKIVRQRVIDLYSEIFEYQVWDAQSGRPVLQQAFSLGVELTSFTYLCHMITALEGYEKMFSGIDKAMSLCNIALLNVVYYLVPTYEGRQVPEFKNSFWRAPFFITNSPVEFQNHLAENVSRLSHDGKWIAVSRSDPFHATGYKKVSLFVKRNLEHFDYLKPVYVINGVWRHFAFTNDSDVLLYVTTQKSLCALSLETGTILSSASGYIPLVCTPEKHVGYFFHSKEEEAVISARSFPSSFLRLFSIPTHNTPLGVAFTSADTILTLCSDATIASWKPSNVDVSFALLTEKNLGSSFCKDAHAEALLSPDGKLITTCQKTNIFLFDRNSLIYSTSVGEDNFIISCLTFSADSAFFLYCTHSSNNIPRFYVWDVQSRAVSATFDSPLGLLPVHCCCFSADNTKFILCCAFNIAIWEYDERPCRLLANVEPFGPFNEFDRFTHCTVSSDNELLACCIVDRILLYPLNALKDQSVLQLPRAHLGRIESCQFLKGSRYLISYGVDGTVFLWDVNGWKAIAYARVAQGRESIVGMAVAPEEDKVVCFTSFGRLSMIKLRELVHEVPSKFPTTDAMKRQRMDVTNRRQLGEEISLTFGSAAFPTDEVEAMDWTKLVEEMNIMADENLESEDDFCEAESDK